MASLESQLQDLIVADVAGTALPGLAVADDDYVVSIPRSVEAMPTRDNEIAIFRADSTPESPGEHPSQEPLIVVDVRSLDYDDAMEMAQLIDDRLRCDSDNAGLAGETLSGGTLVHFTTKVSGPLDTGVTDDSGRYIITAEYLLTV